MIHSVDHYIRYAVCVALFLAAGLVSVANFSKAEAEQPTVLGCGEPR